MSNQPITISDVIGSEHSSIPRDLSLVIIIEQQGSIFLHHYTFKSIKVPSGSVSLPLQFDQIQDVQQVAHVTVDQLQFQRVCPEFADLAHNLDLLVYVLDQFEVVVLLQRHRKGHVLLHLPEILDRPRVRIVIIQFPIPPPYFELPEHS